jgi:hypothetical protein
MSARKHVPLIPIPDFEKRLVGESELEEIKSRTLTADPLTGESTEPVKRTYADIVKRFQITEPSEIYTPSEDDIDRFRRVNPSVHFVNNTVCESNPDEKEFISMPHPSTLFHN